MKKSMFASLCVAVLAGVVSNAYAENGKNVRVYRRVSTNQKAKSATNNTFYYDQANRRKYVRVSNANAQPVSQPVNYEYVNTTQYTQPAQQTYVRSETVGYRDSGYIPYNRNYNDSYVASSYKETSSTKNYVSQERKYFLAHPFFQPLKGNFGSVTDFAYSTNKFNFELLNASVLDIDPNSSTYGTVVGTGSDLGFTGKIKTDQFLVKEDFSFGITDKLAVVAMGQYDSTRVKISDWNTGDPDTKFSDSGLNVFGFGLQLRFVDTQDFIGMLSGYYESQRDTADTFLADLKLGYKVGRTTLYGVGRGGYSRLKNGDIYGAYVDDETGDWLMLSYKTDIKDVMYVEGGLGLFSVLSKYFTLNGEAFFGNYDWHNQFTLKGAIGVQPFDSFALNLYATGVLYDSANDKVKKYMNYDVNPDNYSSTGLVYTTGDYKMKKYNEYKFGAQIILHF